MLRSRGWAGVLDPVVTLLSRRSRRRTERNDMTKVLRPGILADDQTHLFNHRGNVADPGVHKRA
jgi:hypothetical protein